LCQKCKWKIPQQNLKKADSFESVHLDDTPREEKDGKEVDTPKQEEKEEKMLEKEEQMEENSPNIPEQNVPKQEIEQNVDGVVEMDD